MTRVVSLHPPVKVKKMLRISPGATSAAVSRARGVRSAATLCVTAAIHGDEVNSVEIARRAFAGVDAKQLAGTLVLAKTSTSTVHALGHSTGTALTLTGGTVQLAGERQSLAARAWRQVASVLVRESGF